MVRLCAFADEADNSIDGQIRAMKENGVGLLEIRGVDGANISDISIDKAKEVKKKLDDNGLAVWSIGSPIGKIEIDGDFGSHFDKYLHTLELAEVLGAKTIRLFSFYHTNVAISDSLLDSVCEKLTKFVSAADGTGILPCHENEKGIYGDNAERCLKIFENVPGLGGVFDPANFIQCGQDTLEAWKMLGRYITYFHIKDVAADGTIVPAGYGLGHIPEIAVKYLAKGGEVMTLEPHLHIFDGLGALEKEGDKTAVAEFRYASNREAFDAAVSSLKKILF